MRVKKFCGIVKYNENSLEVNLVFHPTNIYWAYYYVLAPVGQSQ